MNQSNSVTTHLNLINPLNLETESYMPIEIKTSSCLVQQARVASHSWSSLSLKERLPKT